MGVTKLWVNTQRKCKLEPPETGVGRGTDECTCIGKKGNDTTQCCDLEWDHISQEWTSSLTQDMSIDSNGSISEEEWKKLIKIEHGELEPEQEQQKKF